MCLEHKAGAPRRPADRSAVAPLPRCHGDRSGYVGPWTNAPTTWSNLYFQVCPAHHSQRCAAGHGVHDTARNVRFTLFLLAMMGGGGWFKTPAPPNLNTTHPRHGGLGMGPPSPLPRWQERAGGGGGGGWVSDPQPHMADRNNVTRTVCALV